MTRVLFVDDEPLVLRSLERALRVQKLPWETRFVHSAEGALELLAREPFDVVITDLRMPDVDGVDLLTEVRRIYPKIVRLVLSGQVGTEECFRVMRVAHQCCAKPCSVATLRHVVQRIVSAQQLVEDVALAEATTALAALPSTPQLHADVCAAIKRGAGLAELAHLISSDIALTAKVMQLVNSAFFARDVKVPTVQRALSVLGPDVLRDLLDSVEVFRPAAGSSENLARLDCHQRHAALVAQVAHTLAPPQLASDAYFAGMLHDVAELVLVEHPGLGDHAKAGAFLLALWGIDDRIVEAISYRHEPGAVTGEGAALVDVLHVAEIVVGELDGDTARPIASEWLARNDTSVLVRARAIAAELFTEGARCAS